MSAEAKHSEPKHNITNELTDENLQIVHKPVNEHPVLISVHGRSELPLSVATQFVAAVQEAIEQRSICIVVVAGTDVLDILSEGLFGAPIYVPGQQQNNSTSVARIPLSTLRSVDWSRVHFVTADEHAEYDTSPPQSNYAHMVNGVLSRLPGAPHAIDMWKPLNHPRLMALRCMQHLRDVVKDGMRATAEREIASVRHSRRPKGADTDDRVAAAERQLAFLRPRSMPVWVSWPRADVVLASVGNEGEIGALYEKHAFYRDQPIYIPRYLDQLTPEDPQLNPDDSLFGLPADACYIAEEQEDDSVAYIPWHANEIAGKRNPHSGALSIRVAPVGGIVDAPAGGEMRVTASAGILNRARKVMFVAIGKHGGRTLKKCIEGYKVLNEREKDPNNKDQYPRGAALAVVVRGSDGKRKEIVSVSTGKSNKSVFGTEGPVLSTTEVFNLDYHKGVPPASSIRPRFGTVEWFVDNDVAADLQ